MDKDGRELRDASISIRDGWITAVGDPEPQEFDREIDCSRFLAVPGFVNAHHHLYQMLTRGFPESDGQGLFAWLQMLYPIWAGLDEEMVVASTLAGLAELALSGCTTCADHLYLFPPGSDGFIDAEVAAARTVGLRFHASRGSMDLGRSHGGLPPDEVVQSRAKILADSERAVASYHDPSPGSMTHIALAPCSPFSVTSELMRESADLARARGVRLHTHIAETQDEDRYSRATYQASPVELLRREGWLADDVWVAHAVHLSASDVELLSADGVSVAHCPTSNMLLGSGLAPVRPLLDAGVTVGLGVDGSASNDGNDLRLEAKQAVLSARVRDGAGALSTRQALRLATVGGAACLGRTDIGRVEPGMAADIVLFDVESLQCAGGQEDLVATMVLGAARPHTVLVHGRPVVEAGRLLTVDGEETAGHLNRASERLMKRWRQKQ
jgi:cytosine/adenosine deaminase-related metal-dependent hydrolase